MATSSGCFSPICGPYKRYVSTIPTGPKFYKYICNLKLYYGKRCKMLFKVLDKLSCENAFEWLFQRAANPGWSGIGLKNPGTSVANIACIESGALYPRIWYHNIKNLQIY